MREVGGVRLYRDEGNYEYLAEKTTGKIGVNQMIKRQREKIQWRW